MQTKLKAVVADREEAGCETLCTLIDRYCNNIEVVGTACATDAMNHIVKTTHPDVIFLDAGLMESTPEMMVLVADNTLLCVFGTAGGRSASPAVMANAVDYLLKPVNIRELKRAEQRMMDIHRLRAISHETRAIYAGYMRRLLEDMGLAGSRGQKVTLSHSRGFDIVEMDEIIRLEAERNYTRVYLSSREPLLIARTLTDFEAILDGGSFARVHKSHIINLLYLHRYINEECGYLVMNDGKRIEISRRRTPDFFAKVRQYTLGIRK